VKPEQPDISKHAQRPNSAAKRKFFDAGFRWLCIATATLSVFVLIVLLYSIVSRGAGRLSYQFLVSSPNSDPELAGIWPALMGTVWTCGACALLTLPIGVGTAIFLEEFKPRSAFMRGLHSLVQLNISNLAGVPSVVYGIIGLTAFVTMFGMMENATQRDKANRSVFEFGATYYYQFLTVNDQVLKVPVEEMRAASPGVSEDAIAPIDGLNSIDKLGNVVQMHVIKKGAPLPDSDAEQSISVRWNETPGKTSHEAWYHFRVPFGRSVLAGSLTLMLVVLPVVIISSQEALRAVPRSMRDAALGMGATNWQSVWNVTLPAAVPGIMTGSILAMSRAVGEAAPIMMISGVVFMTSGPQNLMSDFTVLSLQIFDWSSRHEPRFHAISAAAIIVLLIMLLVFNSLAIVIRQWFSRPLS
jgi:phosphate transport system permease protein